MFRAMTWALALCALATTAVAAPSTPPPPPPTPASAQAQAEARAQRAAAFEAGLTRHTGTVRLSKGAATLDLGDRYYFLGPADARKVLVDAWRNPPDAADGVLGMIFPTGVSPLAEGNWGAVLTYEDSGYVSDKDARKTNYGKLLDQMRSHEGAENKARQDRHFPTVHLVGWAQPPVYDQAHHSLIWARDIRFGGVDHDTVNYDVRVLGRRGVLSMNMVADAAELPQLKPAGAALQQAARFDTGARYADFNAKTDHKAAYGLAGLILAGAGIVAVKKIGLLAVGLLFFKKAFVLILAAFAAVGGWFKRMFGRKGRGDGGGPPDAGSGPWAGGGASGPGGGSGDQIVS